MKNNQLIQTLTELGLNEKEANVYVSALSAGPSPILKIAQAAGLKRTTVYSVIESLKQKGLMTIELKGWKKLFAAEDPEKLETILETRRLKFKNLLPEFSALYNLKGGESFIKYYEGLEAMKSVYEGLIRDVRPHEDYSIIADQRRWYELAPEFFEDFTRRRAKLPINIRMLLQDTLTARKFKKHEKIYNLKIKFLPEGTSLITNLVVIPKKVMIHQLTPPIMAMVIENKSIVQMHQQLFELIWRSTPDC